MRFIRHLFFTVLLFISSVMLAQADELQPGKDYIELNPAQPERVAADKIEVVEFFNFSCPHCFRLQRHFKQWEATKSDDVVVVRQPVVFERFRGHFARVYYALEAMGKADNYIGKVYNAIHKDRRLLNTKSRFLDWLEELGEDRNTAEAIYDSFKVKMLANRAATIAGDYGISSTPQLVVAGKYVVNARISGSYEKMMKTLTALIEREQKQRADG